MKLGLQLRVIGFDPQRDSITHLTSLQHPSDLVIWEGCYDGTDWSDALRDEALTAALGGARPEELDQMFACCATSRNPQNGDTCTV